MTAKHHNHETTDQAAAETPAAVPAPGDPPAASDVTSLADQIAKLLAEKSELTETLIRRQADFENYRKRVERERQTEHHRGIEGLIEFCCRCWMASSGLWRLTLTRDTRITAKDSS